MSLEPAPQQHSTDPTPGVQFDPGSVVLVRSVWQGLLWAADTSVVVGDDGSAITTYTPAGTERHVSTSRGLPGRSDLEASERQRVSMDTCEWNYQSKRWLGSSLNFLEAGRWSQVSLVWLPGGEFLGWYVNFQLPIERSSDGYRTMDLILDIAVDPNFEWRWKDQRAFDQAVAGGTLGSAMKDAIETEAERVLRMLGDRSGPFDRHWLSWSPDPAWGSLSIGSRFPHGLPIPPNARVDESITP